MATLEQLKRKLGSAEQLKTVVRTMKSIAAVTIRQYEQAAETVTDYQQAIAAGLQILLREHRGPLTKLEDETQGQLGVLVVGSDQGMCGQFNERVAQHAAAQLAQRPTDKLLVLAVGRRVVAPLEREGLKTNGQLPLPRSLHGITPRVYDILLTIEQWRAAQRVRELLLYYNRATTGASYTPGGEQLLPLDPSWLAELAAQPWPSRCIPTHSMPWPTLLRRLMRQHLFAALFGAVVQSQASENAARLASMQAAERNIEERLDQLQAALRHERQRSITDELFDIVAGYEALQQ